MDIRHNHHVESGELDNAGYDVILLATGGMPDINIYTTGFDLAVDIWDISGAVKPIGNVLVYDDHGGHQSLDAVVAPVKESSTCARSRKQV